MVEAQTSLWLAFCLQDVHVTWLGKVSQVGVWVSFTSVFGKSELAVTNCTSLCAIWDPVDLLCRIVLLLGKGARVLNQPEAEMAIVLPPLFLLLLSCRRGQMLWCVHGCFVSAAHPVCSLQDRGTHGEGDLFPIKPSTVWREGQRPRL